MAQNGPKDPTWPKTVKWRKPPKMAKMLFTEKLKKWVNPSEFGGKNVRKRSISMFLTPEGGWTGLSPPTKHRKPKKVQFL